MGAGEEFCGSEYSEKISGAAWVAERVDGRLRRVAHLSAMFHLQGQILGKRHGSTRIQGICTLRIASFPFLMLQLLELSRRLAFVLLSYPRIQLLDWESFLRNCTTAGYL